MSTDNTYTVLADRIVLFSSALKMPEVLVNLSEGSVWENNKHEIHQDGSVRRFETTVNISADMPGGLSILNDIAKAMTVYGSIVAGSTNDYGLGVSWDANISKYTMGGKANIHSDEGYTEDNGIYTVIIYLNGDYEGGEVAYVDYDVKIKPAAGDILIFPSYYLHYSDPVLSGQKYMSILRLQY